MTLCTTPWGSYELDSAWRDRSTHIFERVAGERAYTLVIHRDPGGAGLTAEAYAERQARDLARTLPGYAPMSSPALPPGQPRAWSYSWTSPRGTIVQVQAAVPGLEAAVVFTLTGVPDIGGDALEEFLRTVLGARIQEPGR